MARGDGGGVSERHSPCCSLSGATRVCISPPERRGTAQQRQHVHVKCCGRLPRTTAASCCAEARSHVGACFFTWNTARGHPPPSCKINAGTTCPKAPTTESTPASLGPPRAPHAPNTAPQSQNRSVTTCLLNGLSGQTPPETIAHVTTRRCCLFGLGNVKDVPRRSANSRGNLVPARRAQGPGCALLPRRNPAPPLALHIRKVRLWAWERTPNRGARFSIQDLEAQLSLPGPIWKALHLWLNNRAAPDGPLFRLVTLNVALQPSRSRARSVMCWSQFCGVSLSFLI